MPGHAPGLDPAGKIHGVIAPLAKRSRDAVIIAAEAETQEKLDKDIKAAESAEQASTHLAKQRVTAAEGDAETW